MDGERVGRFGIASGDSGVPVESWDKSSELWRAIIHVLLVEEEECARGKGRWGRETAGAGSAAGRGVLVR